MRPAVGDGSLKLSHGPLAPSALALVFLGAGSLLAPAHLSVLWTSVAGASSLIAIAIGLRTKRWFSITPWALVGLALVMSATADTGTVGDSTSVWLGLGAVAALAGCVAFVYRYKVWASIDEMVEVQKDHYRGRGRWGAILVAAAVTLSFLVLRLVPLEDSKPYVEPFFDPVTDTVPDALYANANVSARLHNSGVVESSGLVASRTNQGAYWTHNDSGDSAVLYCFRSTGLSCGRWHVPGSTAVDWEDIAVSGSRPATLFVGDIGDNTGTRAHVTVYALSEPDLSQPMESELSSSLAPRTIELVYPDGPRDAEALVVHPRSGDLYVIAKGVGASAPVYRAAAPLTSHESLDRVGSFSLPGHLRQPTGADISRDGRRMVVSTYGGVYELRVRPGSPFSTIWDSGPRRLRGLGWGQFEGVAYSANGRSVVISEEGRDPRIWVAQRLPG